jgi:hypothetical protein
MRNIQMSERERGYLSSRVMDLCKNAGLDALGTMAFLVQFLQEQMDIIERVETVRIHNLRNGGL